MIKSRVSIEGKFCIMKRFIAVLSSLLVLPAFAEVVPAYYFEEIAEEYAEPVEEESAKEEKEEQKQPVVPAAVSPRNSGRSASSRAVFSTPINEKTTTSRDSSSSRAVVARTASTAKTTSAKTTTARGTASRTAAISNSASTNAKTSTTNQPSVVARRAVPTTNTGRASILQIDTVTTPLYYTNRLSTNNTASVRTRVPTTRMATSVTSETVEQTSVTVDEMAQLTDFCKAQYTACMDNFCNVLDENQGRCSCSPNLSKYSKTEEALKDATKELQDVAIQLNYLAKDLTPSQIEALYTQTEAELTLQNSADNSKIKNDLDDIQKMIVAIQKGDTSSGNITLNFDLNSMLNLDFVNGMFNLENLLGVGNGSSINNQRGQELYNTAVARCKSAVLTSCASQGVDTTVITNAYDLEIDKQCIAYENNLNMANEEMYNKITAAKVMLQVARLQSNLNKNSNDLRGCVTALDECMQDDFVCGKNYENCLDPSGKYMLNGEIIVGSTPGEPGGQASSGEKFDDGLYATWNYMSQDGEKAPWASSSLSLAKYVSDTLATDVPDEKSDNMSEFLQNKIGYHDDTTGKDFGMCMSALNTCQDVTYEGAGTSKRYVFNNKVINEYLQRVLVQIKAQQDTILSDYAEDCITDVAQCLTQNSYNPDSEATASVNNIAIRACKPLITTCMSVNGVTPGETEPEIKMEDWIGHIMTGK